LTSVGVEQLRNVVPSSDKRPAVAQPLPKRTASHLLVLVVVLGLPALLLTACGDGAGEGADDRIKVVTTLPLFADFVREIGGDRVEVHSLVPNGADPHTFEPSPRDVERITEADIAFANGLGLEPGLIKVLEANLRDGVQLVKLGDLLVNFAEANGETVDDPNPHYWLTGGGADFYVATIGGHLASTDPDNAGIYVHGRGDYREKSAGVTLYVRGRLKRSLPLIESW